MQRLLMLLSARVLQHLSHLLSLALQQVVHFLHASHVEEIPLALLHDTEASPLTTCNFMLVWVQGTMACI